MAKERMIERSGLVYKMEYVILVMISLITISSNTSIDAHEVIHRYEVSQESFQVELEKCEKRADELTDKLKMPDGRFIVLIFCAGGPK